MSSLEIEPSFSRPRQPWLAALLSLLGGPVGQIYVGRLRRSLFLWLIGACLFPCLAIWMVTWPIGRLGFLAIGLCLLAFPVYLAVDAFLLARRNRHASPKRYQRWWIYPFFWICFCFSNYVVACFNRAYIGEAFVVPTRSMYSTIQPGDRVLVDKLRYNPMF